MGSVYLSLVARFILFRILFLIHMFLCVTRLSIFHIPFPHPIRRAGWASRSKEIAMSYSLSSMRETSPTDCVT